MRDRYDLSESQLDLNKMVINRFIKKLGNQTDVANYFDISRQSVSRWKRTGKIPLYAAKLIAINLDLDVKKIRPDIFE